MNKFFKVILVAGFYVLSSCGAYFNQPLMQKKARTGEFSSSTKQLLDLPPAAQPVEVAVYNFSDQTGQYKGVENGSTFSTAITQGATTILIKALEDSGWFVPLERENFSNLSTERGIIRNTKEEYLRNLNPNEPALPPLLYAGLLLEGGVISYDTNIVTGGIGARYFGLGGSAKYRQDRITVYLRAVSTNNGEILKTVYVSKTILSQALDASFFRFIKFQRLLEAETGITQNEPVQLAVKDAIEKAVHDLIMEGIKEKFWGTKQGADEDSRLIGKYDMEKKEEESTLLYDRLFVDREHDNSVGVSGGISLIDGDYSTKKPGFMGRLEYERRFARYFSVGLVGTIFDVNNGNQYSNYYGSVDLNGSFDLLPDDDLTPFLYAGAGLVVDGVSPDTGGLEFGDAFFKFQYGAGLRYFISSHIGLKLYVEHNILASDELDGITNGKRDDHYYNFGVGINYNFSFQRNNKILQTR